MGDGGGLLSPGDPAPASVFNPGGACAFVIVCDHAGRAVPERLGDLGLPAHEFDRHIAWDIGVAELGRRLGERLDACVIQQAYSRLVIDCNRSPQDATAMPSVSDGTRVPANCSLTATDIAARVTDIHEPYHLAIAAQLGARASRAKPTVLLLLHSFTPRMGGIDRPWHFGVLHEGSSNVSLAALDLLRHEDGLTIGENEPYAMDGTDYTARRHAIDRGLDYLELEVRQNLLQTRRGLQSVTERLTRLLPKTIL